MSRPVINVAPLPDFGFGHRALVWWATLGVIAIEGAMFALMIANYLYLKGRNSQWPPGVHSPALLYGTLSNGQRYAVKFSDVDGRALSTANGHVIVLVLTAREDLTRARAVGDHVPDYCLGNANYRMITVLNLRKRYTRLGRAIAMTLVRHRVDEEAKRLQTRYDAMKIAHPARQDIYVVADFGGMIAAQLGAEPGATPFHVFVFGEHGELLRQWDDVPSAQELAAAVK